ncbi:MAG: ATP-dependent zinc metalloprotease FtsH [Fimbriimonadaceae bacterium]
MANPDPPVDGFARNNDSLNKGFRILLLTAAVMLTVIFLANFFGQPGFTRQGPVELSVSQFENKIDAGEVQSASWEGTTVTGQLADGGDYTVRVPTVESTAGAALQARLQNQNVNLELKGPPFGHQFLGVLGIILVPLLLIGLLWFLFMRQAQASGNQAMSFGRSRAKRVGEQTQKVTFEDVAGIDEAKQELYEIVDFLKNTKKYTALGAKIPKGILLTGPPGVGKTHISRAVAGEAGVPFFHISGSDFVEMFVGVGAARVRDLFETAKAHRPSLIFIDEIDAVGRQRGAGLGGGHDEREQTLNQLLVEMDGFDPNSGVIMIAATNRPDVLDPALLRPGRFDRQIVVDVPDAVGREKILDIHAKGKPLADHVSLATLAKRTPGFTGADLANLLNESALLAARRNHPQIQQDDLEDALDRVIAGPERKSRVVASREREVIAYHEAGHAIIGHLVEGGDPVHKVTILPRGMSLGSTWHLPTEDRFLVSRKELLDRIAMLLGGRVAEEIVYGEVWTGSSNDLERVTKIARDMVMKYGMSSRLGTLALGRHGSNPFLGRDYSEEQNYSEEVAKVIDEEVHAIVDDCHSRARNLLTENREKLDAVVAALLEHETLDREDFEALMEGKPLPAREPKPAILDSKSNEESSPSRESGSERSPSLGPPRLEPS